MNYLKNHDLVVAFRELKGNPKISIITEPLWFIPFALFSPFASIYMVHIGLTSEQIGFTISIGFVFQMIFAILGGIINDKLGRRTTTLIFDFLSWTIPCFIWAFAQNFWWFLFASLINAAYQVTHTSWGCLFIEDCPPKYLTSAFTLIQLCGMLSVFFSPIAVYFVDLYSVVDVVRVIYFLSGISMSLKFILLYVYGGETKIGAQRMKETKHVSSFELLKGYKDVLRLILKSKEMRFVVLFMALTNIMNIVTGSFFSLYITQKLALSDETLAIFPVVRTVIMLLFVIVLQNVVNRMQMKRSLFLGFVLYIASHIVLLLAPEQSFSSVIFYTILEAAAYAVIIPRKDAIMAFYVLPEERSRITALFNVGMIAISTPFGYIIGKLFAYNETYPFIFNIALFAISILMVLFVKAVAAYDKNTNDDT